MEENKDVTAEGGLSSTSEAGAAFEPGAAVGSKVQCVPCEEGRPVVEDELRVACKSGAERAQNAASVSGVAKGRNMASGQHAGSKLRVASGVRVAGRQGAERRLRIAGGLRAQSDVWAADAYVPHCDQCRKPILRLETYIAVGDVTLCDGCYMNMGTREFLARIGGELRVME